MNDQAKKFRLGIFVLGAVILLAILIILFGEFPLIFTRQINYRVQFKEAPGVEQGTPVRKSGVKIGEVTTFDLDPDSGNVTIHFAVERKYQLRKGDRAVLTRGLVLGETSINFMPDGDRTPAEDGFVFKGETPADVRQALGKAGDLVEEIRSIAQSINQIMPDVREKLLPEVRQTNAEVRAAAERFGKASERIDVLIQGNEQRITKAVERFTDVIGRAADVLSKENQENLTASIQNIRKASDNLDSLVKNTDMLVGETRKTVKSVGERIESVGRETDGLIKESRAVVKRVNETLTRSDEVMKDLQAATKPIAERAPTVMKNLEEFTNALGKAEGSLGRLIHDPALYNQVNEAAASLNKAMCRLDRILQDLQVFADKIARHPEILGVRGAVSPSTGIK